MVGGGGWGVGLVFDVNMTDVRLTRNRMKRADVTKSVFECKDDFGGIDVGSSGVGWVGDCIGWFSMFTVFHQIKVLSMRNTEIIPA